MKLSNGDKIWAGVFAALVLLAAFVWGYPRVKVMLPPSEEDIRSAVVKYMAHPNFSGKGMAAKVLGLDVEMKLFVSDLKVLYMAMPAKGEAYRQETISKLTRFPEKVEWAQLDGNRLVLGDYAFTEPGLYVFRFPMDDLILDTKRRAEYKLGNVTYDVSPEELLGFLFNRSIYAGDYAVNIGIVRGVPLFMYTRSPFIAKKGEPSFTRLADQLVSGARTTEEKIQRLLDFVVREVDYNEADNLVEGGVLKRPNEVLMVQGGSCANKTVLLASLLEQIGVEYLILYMPAKKHATIAVLAHGFPNDNNLSFRYEGKAYAWAEPTMEKGQRFIVGQSVLAGLSINDIEYIQRPGKKVYSRKENKLLRFE